MTLEDNPIDIHIDIEYHCLHCKKIFSEAEIDWDEIENEPLCPICGGYLDEI